LCGRLRRRCRCGAWRGLCGRLRRRCWCRAWRGLCGRLRRWLRRGCQHNCRRRYWRGLRCRLWRGHWCRRRCGLGCGPKCRLRRRLGCGLRHQCRGKIRQGANEHIVQAGRGGRDRHWHWREAAYSGYVRRAWRKGWNRCWRSLDRRGNWWCRERRRGRGERRNRGHGWRRRHWRCRHCRHCRLLRRVICVDSGCRIKCVLFRSGLNSGAVDGRQEQCEHQDAECGQCCSSVSHVVSSFLGEGAKRNLFVNDRVVPAPDAREPPVIRQQFDLLTGNSSNSSIASIKSRE